MIGRVAGKGLSDEMKGADLDWDNMAAATVPARGCRRKDSCDGRGR